MDTDRNGSHPGQEYTRINTLVSALVIPV
jgi:hypothetical protein